MLEMLIELINGKDAESVMDFHARYIEDDEMEDTFFKAIRDTRLAGFTEGMKFALLLFIEIRGDKA